MRRCDDYELLACRVACELHAARDAGRFRISNHGFSTQIERDSIIGPLLGGACAIAAIVVSLMLRERGVRAGPIQGFANKPGWRGYAHWWAETDDGYIVDPTFGQFSASRRGKGPIATRSRAQHTAIGGVPIAHLARIRTHPSCPGKHRLDVLHVLSQLGVAEERAVAVLRW